jgi:hypothetical protein
MSDIRERLKASIASGSAETQLLSDALGEITELKQRLDALEKTLIVLVRTPVPWDDDVDATEAMPHFQERYHNAMHEVSDLLGLGMRSRLARTEPKT